LTRVVVAVVLIVVGNGGDHWALVVLCCGS
jgi:hypothetical protein